jgi:hypothetical protein
MKDKNKDKLADGSSIAIPCVFSADATGADIGIVVVVDSRGGVVVLGVVGCEDISSSCMNKDDIDLSMFRSVNKVKDVNTHTHTHMQTLLQKSLKSVTDEW